MAEQEQEQDKTEPATPFKLREASKRGTVTKSQEVNSLLVLATALAVLAVWHGQPVVLELRLYREIFSHAGDVPFNPPQFIAWLASVAARAAFAVAPLIAGIVAIAVLANLLQVGPIFSLHPLKPDLQRINPVAGFKRVFSLRLLFEALKSLIKLAVLGAIAYAVVVRLVPRMLGLMQTDPHAYPPLIGGFVTTLLFKLLLGFAVVALLDLLYTRWDFAKRMRMSRREMKEEVKRREGDPAIRARIRQLQKELAKRSKAVRRVPDADVLITNPTHLAIALAYERGRMPAPKVLAKGRGALVEQMKTLARRHRVAIVEDRSLARALYAQTRIDECIPEALYPQVARVLSRVYKARLPDVAVVQSNA